MSKRHAPQASQDDRDDHRHAKRQRVEGKPRDEGPAEPEKVTSARQLRHLLIFQQDSVVGMGNGKGVAIPTWIRSFKSFLETILYPADGADVPAQWSILNTFLDSQVARGGEPDETVLVPEILEMWNFASLTNNDHLQSAVVAVLALLLKTLSGVLERRDHGVMLCKTILQRKQVRMLSWGLTAPRHKEHIISPCLRLLTEVVSFDGGAMAGPVYATRDLTFDNRAMVRNLGLKRRAADETPEDRRKSSVRSNAVRYLLAHVRFQKEGPRMDILAQGNILRSLFEHIRDDPPALIVDTISVVKQRVILDGAIPRSSKSQLLTEHNLACLARLYRAPGAVESPSEHPGSVRERVHDVLTCVCTTPNLGVLLPSSGWYPPGAGRGSEIGDGRGKDASRIDLGLDALEGMHRDRDRIPVRNVVLASFAQSLRPHANRHEHDLTRAMFRAAPELVADYFRRKEFPFDPKLTPTWIGYAAFLVAAIQLPVPSLVGSGADAEVPPPVSIVVESVLPRPLTQKVMTKCLNHASDLVNLLGARLLVVAGQKLERVLQTMRDGPRAGRQLWQQAADRVRAEVARRYPLMRDVIVLFRRSRGGQLMVREVTSRLLATYYTVAPEIACAEKFDMSVALTDALAAVEREDHAAVERELRVIDLGHLVLIAQRSLEMRWWSKPGKLHSPRGRRGELTMVADALTFTPFMVLLRLIASRRDHGDGRINELVNAIVESGNIVQHETVGSALDVLIASLREVCESDAADVVCGFLDSCVTRLVQKPLRYQDGLDERRFRLHRTRNSNRVRPLSPLVEVLREQWPFIAKSGDITSANVVGGWMARFLTGLKRIGEDDLVLVDVTDEIEAASDDVSFRGMLAIAASHADTDAGQAPIGGPVDAKVATPGSSEDTADRPREEHACVDADEPPKEDENHPGLTRWMHHEVDQAVEDGHVADLVLSLCSEHGSIRIEALTNARKLLAKLKGSSYAERQQVGLLVGEVVETAHGIVRDRRLPYVAGVFATHAIAVLADPAHVLYPKINRFLNRGPSWNVERLPSYWVGTILLDPPFEDEGYHQETAWLLDLFHDGLRTSEDMEIYRARGVFERVLALSALPTSRRTTREKVLKLVSRAVVCGGATTLITRAGVLDWVAVQRGRDHGHDQCLRALHGRLMESCDRQRIAEWSGGSIACM